MITNFKYTTLFSCSGISSIHAPVNRKSETKRAKVHKQLLTVFASIRYTPINTVFFHKKKQERAYMHPKEFPTSVNLIHNTRSSFLYAKQALSLSFLHLKTQFVFSAQKWKHISTESYRNAFFAYAVTGCTRPSLGLGAATSPAAFVFSLDRYLSTAAAASLPSEIAQTTSDCPRLQSPAANTPSTFVAKFPN